MAPGAAQATPAGSSASGGITDYLFSADAKVGLPCPLVLALILAVGGLAAIVRGRR